MEDTSTGNRIVYVGNQNNKPNCSQTFSTTNIKKRRNIIEQNNKQIARLIKIESQLDIPYEEISEPYNIQPESEVK